MWYRYPDNIFSNLSLNISNKSFKSQGSDVSSFKSLINISVSSNSSFSYRPFLTWSYNYSSKWLGEWYNLKSEHLFFLRFNWIKVYSMLCCNIWTARNLLSQRKIKTSSLLLFMLNITSYPFISLFMFSTTERDKNLVSFVLTF